MNVFSILQDRKGFLWFGTGNGLNRFDGYVFTVFQPESSGWIHDIVEDQHGDLWLGTDRGLLRFHPDRETFDSFRPEVGNPHSLGHQRISSLHIDGTRSLWIGTENGLDRLDFETESFTHFQHRAEEANSPSHNQIFDLDQDSEGTLWIATGKGLDRFDPARGIFSHFSLPAGDPDNTTTGSTSAAKDIRSLQFDAKGSLWVTSSSGLFRLVPGATEEQASLVEVESMPPIRHLVIDAAQRLWLGTVDQGLLRYDPMSGETLALQHEPENPASLGHNTVSSLYTDRGGVVWVGTSPGGISYADPLAVSFDLYRHQPKDGDSLGGSVVTALEEGSDGYVWVGTFGRGLDRFDRSSERFEHYRHRADNPQGLGHDRIMDLARSPRGDLWIATQGGGLSRLDPATGIFHHFRHDPADPRSLAADRVASLYIDSEATLWVGTQGLGIDRLEPGSETFTHYPPSEDGSDGPGHGLITHFVSAADGGLWVGTWGGGLDFFDPETGHFEHYRNDPENPDSLGHNVVRYLHVDRRGHLWIGTDGAGLDYFVPGQQRFRHYTETNGLVNGVVHGILEDDAGFLWLSTNRGIARLEPQTGRWASFDLEDGLQDLEFNFGSCLRTADGELFFGGIRGFNSFHPNLRPPDTSAPLVFLTAFESAPEAVDLPRAVPYLDRVVLDHQNNDFTFEVSASSFLRADKNRYQYILEGFEKTWSTVGTRRFGRYTNVPPGSYKLRIRAADHRGEWSPDGAMIQLEVLPPPWRTPWAFGLYTLAAVGLVLTIRHSQQRKLAQKEALVEQYREIDRLKDEFLTTTSHALRTPLYGITGLAESLLDRPQEQISDSGRQDLQMILASGRRLSHLVDDILDHSRLSRGSIGLERRGVDLRALADVVLALSRPLVGNKPLRLVNAVPRSFPLADADENRIAQVLHNLVDNAIKYTAAGTIEVAAEKQGASLRISVRDSGIGIPKDQRQHIFEAFATGASAGGLEGGGLGLTISQQLVKLHGGKLEVQSNPGQGTILAFSLPIAEPDSTAPETWVKQDTGTPESEAGHPPGSRRQEISAPREPRPFPPGPQPLSTADNGRYQILIVDDEAVNRAVLNNHLSSAGYGVEQAAHGPEALDRLNRGGIDLIVLDVMMPQLSGYEVCQIIRREYPLEKLPILFLTAKTQVADLVAGLGVGGNDFLAKPIAKEELLARVGTHLELLDVHRKLAQLVLDLEARNAELARFNYTVSHDLRNPLVTISNYLGVVRRDFETGHEERVGADLDRLETAANKLQHLLGELFQLSQAGSESRPFEAVPLDQILTETLARLDSLLTKHRVEVVVSDDLPVVHGDPARLSQVFWHLLDNAVRFLGDQPEPRVDIGRLPGDRQTVFIRDNGRGIEARHHEQIFGIFEKTEPGDTLGNGIGLALVRRILEVHGGRIWVESAGPNQGSTFFFSVPAAASATREKS